MDNIFRQTPVTPIPAWLKGQALLPPAPPAQKTPQQIGAEAGAEAFGRVTRQTLGAIPNKIGGMIASVPPALAGVGTDVLSGLAAVGNMPETSARLNAFSDGRYAAARGSFNNGTIPMQAFAPPAAAPSAPAAPAAAATLATAPTVGRTVAASGPAMPLLMRTPAEGGAGGGGGTPYSMDDLVKGFGDVSYRQFNNAMQNAPSAPVSPKTDDIIGMRALQFLEDDTAQQLAAAGNDQAARKAIRDNYFRQIMLMRDPAAGLMYGAGE
jgi:hypothetical protein